MNVTIEERSDKFLTAKWRMDAGGLVKIDNLEPSLIEKYSICNWVFETNFEFIKLPGCSFWDDFVALCHAVPCYAVPLTRTIASHIIQGVILKTEIKAKLVVRQGRKAKDLNR